MVGKFILGASLGTSGMFGANWAQFMAVNCGKLRRKGLLLEGNECVPVSIREDAFYDFGEFYD